MRLRIVQKDILTQEVTYIRDQMDTGTAKHVGEYQIRKGSDEMFKWRGTPLDQLTDPQIEDVIEKTLEILSAMYMERQGRRSKYRDEIRRQAEQEMQLKSLREGSRIHKRF